MWRVRTFYKLIVVVSAVAILWNPGISVNYSAWAHSPARQNVATRAELKRLNEEATRAFGQHAYAAAEQGWRAALETAQALKITPAIANMHNDLAMVYVKLKRFPEAISHAVAARTLYMQLNDPVGVIDNLLNEGMGHVEQDEYAQAKTCFTVAKDAAIVLKDRLRVCKADTNLGLVYYRQSEYDKALPCFASALGLPENEDTRILIANAYTNRGLIFDDLGLFAQALEAHQQAQRRYEAIDDPEDSADCHNHQGMAYHGLHEYAKAQEQYEIALKMCPQEQNVWVAARVLNNLGILYDDLEQSEKALDYLTQALEIKRKFHPAHAIARGLSNRGSILTRLRRFDLSLTDLNEALTLCKGLSNPLMTAGVLTTLGSLYAEQGRLEEAQGAYEEALQYYEKISQQVSKPGEVGLFEQAHHLRLYAGYAALHVRKGHPQAALEIIERGRAQGLLQQARKNHILVAASISQKTYAQLKTQVADRHPDTLFVEYVVVDADTTLALTFSQEGIHSCVLRVGDRALTRMADAWRKQLDAFRQDKGDKQAEEQAAHALYDALLAPLVKADLIRPTIQRLVIVADGPLLDLPFAALLDTAKRRLVDRYSLSEAVSLSTLALPLNPRKPTANMLAVADPTGKDRPNRQKAPGTLLDAPAVALPLLRDGLRKLLGRYPQSLGLFGKKAIKSEVKKRMSDYTVLNFGTHGKYIGSNGLYSYLVLATGDGSNGLLEAREIVPLRLSAQMATLWACESGLGQRSGGDGLLGLAWAFQAAGCPSVIASQWQVDEEATALLMEAFYTALAKPGMRKDAALQEAMKVVRTDARFHSPFYWAGFQVIGDTKPLTLIPHGIVVKH